MTMELKTYTCNCCGMLYDEELEKYISAPFQCSACRHHRDADTVEALIAQGRDHRQLWDQYAEDLRELVAEAQRRASSTYHVRGLALEVLNRINAAHDLRPNGSCSCGVKACKVGPTIMGNRLLAGVIRDYDTREQKKLARIRKEESWDEHADEWDQFIDERIITPPPAAQTDSEAVAS